MAVAEIPSKHTDPVLVRKERSLFQESMSRLFKNRAATISLVFIAILMFLSFIVAPLTNVFKDPIEQDLMLNNAVPEWLLFIMPEGAERPTFTACRLMDFELEMGFFVGHPSRQGEPVGAADAMDHIFGMVLVNDWSARDIQKWEYQPLGPFNAKNFATSISPWVVTMDALAAFRCPAPVQEPAPLDYLHEPDRHTYDINLEVGIQAENDDAALVVCESNYKHLYWTMAQQLTKKTSTGCNLS